MGTSEGKMSGTIGQNGGERGLPPLYTCGSAVTRCQSTEARTHSTSTRSLVGVLMGSPTGEARSAAS
jgi:hypothetical protein